MKRRDFILALAGLPALARAQSQAAVAAVAFAPVLAGHPLEFPRDHGAHPAFRTEWWYATGWLNLPDGSPLGFQTTFFRVRTGIGEDNPVTVEPLSGGGLPDTLPADPARSPDAAMLADPRNGELPQAMGLHIRHLDSERRIALGLHPEVQEELTQRQQQEQEILSPLENQLRQEMPYGATASVDGRDISVLDERKGWYREERHGREVEVGEIAVHPSPIEGKYKMTAVIDGQVITHEISQKDYDKFLAVDDYHRMKIFSKIFSEVDMKMRPEAQRSLGVKIFAALTAGTVITAGVVHGLRHHHHGPEFYGERFGGPPHPYFKPGVDTPRDVAIRNFEAQMNQDINDMRRGR